MTKAKREDTGTVIRCFPDEKARCQPSDQLLAGIEFQPNFVVSSFRVSAAD